MKTFSELLNKNKQPHPLHTHAAALNHAMGNSPARQNIKA
jgi:hypothetical protein